MKMTMMALAAGMVLATAAHAETGSGYVQLKEGVRTSTALEHCEGSAYLAETYVSGVRTPVLKIQGVTHCSVIYIDGVKQSEKIKQNEGGTASVTIFEQPGVNVHTIRMESGSGKTADTIQVVSYGAAVETAPRANITFDFGFASWVLGGEQSRRMYDCGGTVRAKVQDNNVYVIFSDVENCKSFDILASNGSRVDYPVKKLQVAAQKGTYYGSFQLPKKVLNEGGNSVTVILKSSSGGHDEVIQIRFLNY